MSGGCVRVHIGIGIIDDFVAAQHHAVFYIPLLKAKLNSLSFS